MKHLFVINPVAGGKKHDPKKTESDILTAMEKIGGDYEIYYTTGPRDATRKVKEEAASGGELRVYACGGDGTLNECVNGAAGMKNAAVAHYPCGTGNDFIKCFEHERVKFFSIGDLIGGEVHPIDLIDCGNGMYGLNIASVGIDARVGADVHKYSALPFIGGAGGYVVSMIVNVMKGIGQELTIIVDGKTIQGKFTMVSVCNGRYYGGGFNPVPEALPNDGLLDILIVKNLGIVKVALLIGDYAKGKYKQYPKYIRHIRGKNIRIESRKEILVGFDGESYKGKTVEFKVVPDGVNMIFPRGMEFFSAQSGENAGDKSKTAV